LRCDGRGAAPYCLPGASGRRRTRDWAGDEILFPFPHVFPRRAGNLPKIRSLPIAIRIGSDIMECRASEHLEGENMTMEDRLRKAITASKQTLYRVAKGAGINYSVLFNFVKGSRRDIRLSTVQALCEYLGLELATKRGGK